MCHFITLVAPAQDADALNSVMKRHGRNATPVDNRSIAAVLRADETQFLTTAGHCDCGTVLARNESPEALEERLAKEAARLKRKGWSATKIARAIEDRRRADSRPDGGGSDSLELWVAILRDLRDDLRLPHAGLFVGLYSGAIDTEQFAPSRREVPRQTDWYEALRSIEPDQVTIIPLR